MPHGVLVLDKPSGPTSHDIVQRVRRALGVRAVGHAGTLDPLATGVLVIGVGEGTKLLHHLSAADKAYRATLRLGVETDTLDSQGRASASAALPEALSLAFVREVAARFVGPQQQRVPDFSAIKQAGERLYERARRGEAIEAPERSVVVHALEIVRVEGDEIELQVRCGKGFYVRALARDLARALGTVGHLCALRRTASGAFSLSDALDCGTGALDRELLSAAILQPSAALRGRLCVCVNEAGLREIGFGRPILAAHLAGSALPTSGEEPIGLLDVEGRLRALGRAEADRIVIVRGLLA
jgi:tRNA pseudouridine55 synthase